MSVLMYNMPVKWDEETKSLLKHFDTVPYSASAETEYVDHVVEVCQALAGLDYSVSIIDNSRNDLCDHYPRKIIIMEPKSSHYEEPTPDTKCKKMDITRLREQMRDAASARLLKRFPVPVINYDGKNICRSSTLACCVEAVARNTSESLLDTVRYTGENICDAIASTLWLKSKEEEDVTEDNNTSSVLSSSDVDEAKTDKSVFSTNRNQDIMLLNLLGVGTIVDLMVEEKKVTYIAAGLINVTVTSSEKVDRENRYSDFNILSLPYPGCEFFQEFRGDCYDSAGLHFDWSQSHVNAPLKVPESNATQQVCADWSDYKKWDLDTLTKNYFKLILSHVFTNSCGLLVHCICGWDRTPLFISMLRMSLWADGLIHETLNEEQMIYFTIAYDWFLFKHNLKDRKEKGEDIFFFCFYFLSKIMDEEFSYVKYTSGGNKDLKTADVGSFPGSNFPTIPETSSPPKEAAHENMEQGDKPPRTSNSSTESNKTGWIDDQTTAACTSPIQIPGSQNRATRTRDHSISESMGSLGHSSPAEGDKPARTSNSSVESNQTGSIEDQDHKLKATKTSPIPIPRQQNQSTRLRNDSSSSSWSSLSELITPKVDNLSSNPILKKRRHQLELLRTLFYSYYHTTLSHNPVENKPGFVGTVCKTLGL